MSSNGHSPSSNGPARKPARAAALASSTDPGSVHPFPDPFMSIDTRRITAGFHPRHHARAPAGVMLAMAGETSPPSRAYQRQEEGSRTAVDEDIIALMRAGRPDEALARLVPAYRRRVFGLAYGILGDRAAAEDVAQEVFVKVWQAFDSFDGRAQLSTWIYAITRNAAISALRKRPRAVSMSEEAVATQVDALRADGDPEDAGDAQLWRLVETLPDKQRQAIVLFYQEDRSIEDIAGMLGMPVNTVKTHLHRGRARLAAALGTDKEAAA